MLFIVLALALVQDTPTATEALPTLVTIAEIHEDPWAWDGRRVRVVGDFAECAGLSCEFCDEIEYYPGSWASLDTANEARQCAGITFRLGDTGDQIARFNRLLIDAAYDAGCSGVRDPRLPEPEPHGDTYIVCGDRATELSDAIILDILAERPSTAFSPADNYDWTVEPAPDDVRNRLIEAFWQAAPWVPPGERNPDDLFVFVDMLMAEGSQPDFSRGVCVCDNAGECADDTWPTLHFHLPVARGNPYTCYWAFEREDGSWVFPLQ